ncbi:MAG: T3SS (YopN, CesT) and YbjN peptide-binding chaperone 1 [Chlorobiota bacterium]
MSQNINEVNEKLKSFFENNYNDTTFFEDDSFTITKGSTQVMVRADNITEDHVVIDLVSHVVKDANVNDDIKNFLLRANSELKFGGFGLLFDDTIIFQHSILANDFSESNLKSSINAVASVADYYDDILVEKAGGKRALDDLEIDG